MGSVLIRITRRFNITAITMLVILLISVGAWATSPPAPLPHTGQTECWDTSGALIACVGTGQDGELRGGVAWPSTRFTDNGDQTIIDNLTGLIWTKDANLMMTRDPAYDIDGSADGKVTWLRAISYVKKLNTENYLGYSDWRLPNRNELESMINKQKPDQSTWLNSQGFNNIWADGYWSAGAFYIPNSYYLYYQWFVNMSDGTVDAAHNSFTYGVWPVRSGQVGTLPLPKTGNKTCYDPSGSSITCNGSGQDGELQVGAAWPAPRFIVNSDQTVTDALTGLAWSREASSPGPSACKPNSSKSWQSALNHVMCLNTNSYLGYNDWRLPNRNELASLINQGELNSVTWLTSNGFTDAGYYTLQSFWSSSTYAANPTKAWIAVMDYGYLRTDIKTDLNSFVWPVRSGQTGPPGDTVVPVISSFVIPVTSTNLTVPVTAFTAGDNTGVTGYCLSTTNIVADCIWSATPQTSYTFPSEGTKTLYAFAKDAALNVSAAVSGAVTITLPDITKPVVTVFTIPATSTTLFVAVSSLTATDNVTVTGYLITESSTVPLLAAMGWSATQLTGYTYTGIPDGIATTKKLYAWAKDAAGNISNSAIATSIITLPDVTNPVITAFIVPASGTSLTIAVSTLTATDNVAVTGYLLTESVTAPLVTATGWRATKPTSYSFSGIPDGIATTKTLFVWAKDAVGNVSLSKSAIVVVTLPDATVPVVTEFTIPPTSTSLIVPISILTATDNIAVNGYLLTETSSVPVASNADWNAAKPASYAFATAGLKTLYAWAKDAGGNISASMSATVTVDTTGPTLTLSTLSDGAVTKDATLNISGTVSDTSGVADLSVNGTSVTVTNGSFSYPVTLQAGANTITTIATDMLGNRTTDTRTIFMDITAPVLTISAPADNSTTAQALATITGTISETSTVTVAVNTGTVQSASITGSTYSATVNLANGINTIDITATDLAGNTSTTKRTITYDNTVPSLSVSNPAQDISTALGSIIISGTVTDTITSAVLAMTADGQTYAPTVSQDGSFSQSILLPTDKTYAVVVTATDQATNSVTVQRNVIKSTPLTQPTINDALKVLQAVIGIAPLTASEQIRYDVAPLSASGTPAGNGSIDAADVILILRRSIGIGSW